MKRALVTLALVATASLGVSGCSGSSDKAAEPAKETATATVEKEESTTEEQAAPADQTVAEACLQIAEPMQQASEAAVALADNATDLAGEISADPAAAMQNIQGAMDLWKESAATWRSLADGFAEFDANVTNADVKAVSSTVAKDASELSNQIQKVYVDLDLTAMDQFTAANDAFSASYQKLAEVCAQQ